LKPNTFYFIPAELQVTLRKCRKSILKGSDLLELLNILKFRAKREGKSYLALDLSIPQEGNERKTRFEFHIFYKERYKEADVESSLKWKNKILTVKYYFSV